MTDKLAAVPTEPADNDVVVWEPYDKGSDREARWLWVVSGDRHQS